MIQINVDATTDPRELAAIAALIGVLRGDVGVLAPMTRNEMMTDLASPAPSAMPSAPPAPPAPASESLIEAEGTRVTTVVDSSGLPYDGRIHSSTRAINQDKTWRNKRGVDPALLASVTAELRAAAEPSPEAAFSPPADAIPVPLAQPPVEQQPPAPPAPPIPPPPAAPAGDPPLTFAGILKEADVKGLTYNELNGIAEKFGLTKFADLNKRPDLFESFMAALG